ncbi:hypothetical protein [Oceanisphaera ostreae]|uniref:Mobilization protein n=1 Tax=Oceanisphaera ostreae TaxID=914151 RepID=A0ABW3KD60_9GAMM
MQIRDEEKRVKRGRRKLELKDKRTNRETTNFNNAELNQALKEMRSSGFTDMSSFLRARALNEVSKPVFNVPKINEEARAQLISTSSNLNQFLKLAHEGKASIGIENLEQVVNYVIDLNNSTQLMRKEMRGQISNEGIKELAEQLTTEELMLIIIKKGQ